MLTFGTTAFATYDSTTNTDTLANQMVSPTRGDLNKGDLHSYDHADRNLVINWNKDNHRGDGSAIRDANVNAKNITINADFEGNQWDDKGIISDGDSETHVTASGDINIRTHDDAVHTENDHGKITIDGFKNLNITTTGESFGVMDAGDGVFINGGTGSTVNISALTGERPAIGASLETELAYQDPKYAMGTGITINADKIILSSPNASVYAGIGENHDFKVNLNAKTVNLTGGIVAEGGSTVSINPDIDGVVKITSSKENNSSIMARMDSTGKVSNVIINGNKGGTVQALGEIEADDASVYINMTGAGSYIKSTATGNTTEDSLAKDVLLANGDKAKIKLDFSGNNSLIRGDMNATDGGALDINASGDNFSIARSYTWDEPFRHGVLEADRKGTANLILTGNHNRIDGSLKAYYNGQINLKMSGNDAVFNGNMWTEIDTPKESPQHSRDDNAAIRAEFSGKNAQMKGDIVSREGHSQITADFSGENGKLTGDAKAIGTFEMTYDSRYPDKRFYTITDGTVTNLDMTGVHASQIGNLVTEGNNTLNASYTGLGSSLTGNADNKGIMNLTFDNRSSMTGNMSNDTMKYEDDKGTTFAGQLKANFNNGSRWTGDLTNTSGTTNVDLNNGSLWTGNLSSAAGTTTINLNNASAWTGASTGNGDITLTNGSLWTVTKDSTADSVKPDGSSVVSLAGAAKKLEVQKLGGTGGTFLMDLSYHNNDVNTYRNGGSDFVVAHGGNGSAYNVSLTNNSSVNGMTDGSKLYFASTAANSSTFRMNQSVQVANYNKIYNKNLIVKKEMENSDPDYKGYDDWFLTPDSSKGNGGNVINPNGIVPGSAANAAFALWRDDDTLLKRLGELRYNQQDDGIWARLVNKHLERDGRHGFKGNYKTIQVGYDKKKDTADNSSWYYGGAVSHLWGDTDYTDGYGKQKETDLSLYGTNIRPHGHYLDLIARVGRIDSDYTTSYGDHGEFENWGMSIGAEYGRKKVLGSGWSLEPQAQLTYHYLWGDDYTTSNGAKVSQDNADSLVGRLGFVLGKEFKVGTPHAGRVYLKASVLHDFLGDTDSRITDDLTYHDDDDLGDTWYVAGVGTDVYLGSNTRFYFDAERNFNADVKMKYRFNAGLRFGF